MTAAREALLVLTACTLVYLTAAGDHVPFFTRGEPREALVAREMLRRGEWLVPARPEGEPARKPPFYYWLAASALRGLPAHPELALRLPSAVLGTAAVLGTWATARATWGPAAGLPAALVLATAFEWMRAATSARVDMALAAALAAVLCGWTLALAAGPPRRVRAGLFLAAAGGAVGTLAKGPVAIVLAGLTAAGLLAVRRDRAEWRRLRPLLVLGVAAAAAGLWYGAAVAREGTAMLDVVVRENLLRFVDTDAADTGHAHGAAYLPVVGLAGWLPWVPLLPLALVPLRGRPRPATAVLAAVWIVAGGVFFSLASSKRSVYLLPLYPALALLTGAGVAAAPSEGGPAGVARSAAAAYAPLLAVLAALVGALALGVDVGRVVRPWLKPPDAAGADAFAAAVAAGRIPLGFLAVASLALVPVVARAAGDGAWRRLVVLVTLLTVAWTWAFNVLVYPAIAGQRSMRTFLRHVETLVPCDAPLYAMYPPDPGVRFYAPGTLSRWPGDGGGGHLLLWEDEWRRLRDATGRPLTILAVSEAQQGRRGHLALVLAPPGGLRDAPPDETPPRPPGLRTGSSPR